MICLLEETFVVVSQGRLPDVFTHVLVSYIGILYPHWSKIDD
jgi:hypothetical protein